MRVRQLTAADLAAYRALHRFGIEESPTGFTDGAETDATRPDAEVAATLTRGEGWGAFEGHRLVGKLTADALPYPSLAPTFWLRAVYVHPDARGTGASGRLIRAAIEDARAKGGSRMALWVHAANPHAQALYKRLGFRENGGSPRAFASTASWSTISSCRCRSGNSQRRNHDEEIDHPRHIRDRTRV